MDPSTFTDQSKSNRSSNQSADLNNWASGYDGTMEKGFFDNIGTHFIDFIQTFVVFAAIFALIYLFASQPHKVSGNSMFPTFHDGDYILTDKITYRFSYPQKGDVVVFKNPRDESQDFIKRVIGIPGDTVKVQNNKVYVNDQEVNEYYLPPNTPTRRGSYLQEGVPVKVDDDNVIVIGDNRDHSSDSREWGQLPKDKIIGKVFFRYWPPQVFGFFKALP